MKERLKGDQIRVNKALISEMVEGIEEILESLEIMVEGVDEKKIKRRIADIESGRIKPLGEEELEEFMKADRNAR